MAKDTQDYLDLLKESRRMYDLSLLRKIIQSSSGLNANEIVLDEELFEKIYKLQPLPMDNVTDNLLNQALNYKRAEEEITSSMRPLKPSGTTIRQQIESILPKNLDEQEKRSLSYALARIVIDRVPKINRWPVHLIGLDYLSAAILSIYNISRIVDQRIPWLYCLWLFKIEEAKTQVLKKILDKFRGEFSRDNIIDELRQADETINMALGQDPNIDISIAQPDPLSRKINEWIRQLSRTRDNDKETKRSLRKEIYQELATLKGFSAKQEREIDVRSVSSSHIDIFALRPDGPLANDYETLLQLFRREINILEYPPLMRLCTNLSRQKNIERVKAKDIEKVSQYRGRSAYYAMERFENILQELFIPSLRKIGLRYRYIFTPRQRPGVISDGLVERMILSERSTRGCTIHIEPSWTKGPDPSTFPQGAHEAVVEDEIVALNLDKFDVKEKEWILPDDAEVQFGSKKARRVVECSTHSRDNQVLSLTERQLELLSILWRFEGSRTQRKWFLDKMQYPTRTAIRMLRQMLDSHILKTLYLPALELCKLPDGLMAAANCYDRRSRDRLINQLSQRLPFTRVLFGDSNDVVLHARIPAKESDHAGGIIQGIMEENSDYSIITRLRASRTYQMSVLHRIREPSRKEWTDPWLMK